MEGFNEKEGQLYVDDLPISEIADVSIPIPSTIPMLTPLLSVLPTQLIAYHAALALDNDVDRPRNLAKSVTVE